jgi:hypothetical protein
MSRKIKFESRKNNEIFHLIAVYSFDYIEEYESWVYIFKSIKKVMKMKIHLILCLERWKMERI